MPQENIKDYAIVIGINDYFALNPLKGAIHDAMEMEKWLVAADGGNLPASNCKHIFSEHNPLFPDNGGDIDDKLEEIYNEAIKSGGKRFYFYFSGHGLGTEVDDTALCLPRWSEIRRGLALSSRKYLNLFMESGLFEEVIFFLDCCRNRKIGHKGLDSTIGWPKPGDKSGASQDFVAIATEYQDSAYEAEMQTENGTIVRGHFTHALLDGLRGAAVDDQGRVTASKLKDHLEIQTPRLAKQANQSQFAKVKNGFSAVNGEIFFGTVKKITVNCTIAFTPGRAGNIQLIGPDDEVVKTGDASTGPWAIELQKKLYILIDTVSGEEISIRAKQAKEDLHVEF